MLRHFCSWCKKTILWLLPKSLAHKYLYRKRFGKRLDLKSPHDFNEKIQYLIVKKFGKKEGLLVDKKIVKKYVAELGIKDLSLPKTIRTYTEPDKINISELPERFVLKCNHSSGDVFVCNDKNTFNLDEAKQVLKKKIREKFAKRALEYHYSDIKPVIMAEEYLDDGTGKNPLDYKFYVFNGVCDRILVCSERDNELRLDDFDRKWNYLDDTLPKYRSKRDIPKPKNLEKMIKIAEELCKKDGKVVIPFARIDLYDLNGRVYFGEYTFTPAMGLIDYYNQRALNELGAKLNLEWYS